MEQSDTIYGDLNLFKENYLRISWNLTNLCHNHCWYCFNRKSDKRIKFSSKREIEYNLNYLFKRNYKYYDFILLGGEPLLNPNIEFLLKLLVSEKRVRYIYILSTIIREILFREKVIPCITVHPSSSIEQNIVSISSLIDYNPASKITIMLDPTCREKTLNLYNELKKITPNIIASSIRKPPNFDIFLDFPPFKIPQPISYHGIYCLHGMTSLKIHEDNSYYGAICNCAHKNFKPAIVKCTSNSCNCIGNHHIIKTYNLKLAVELMKNFIDRIGDVDLSR